MKNIIDLICFFPIASLSSLRLLLASMLLVGGISASSGMVMAQNAKPSSVPEGETPIRITVGDVVMTGRFNSTTMARRMVERLPVTLTFGNHSGGDTFPTKVTHLDPALPVEGTELGGAPDRGDIAHYVPNGNFGFYYGKLDYWSGVVTLGSFDGDPNVFAHQTGPFEVKIELAK